MITNRFKTGFAERIFRLKYAQGESDTWDELSDRLVEDVCGSRNGTERLIMSDGDRKQLAQYIKEMKFIPGGRYLYYAGRDFKAYNNCYLLRAEEDTREEWAQIAFRSMSCLSSGGGIGVDYSTLRPYGRILKRTGGTASGPIPLMQAVNEIGRNVMQGGSRRSAIYASLNWKHEDIPMFLVAKNWSEQIIDIKAKDFNFPAMLDMTNISVNYDDDWKFDPKNPIFLQNCKQAMMTGEPGFSFNFGDKQNETLRNAPVAGHTRVLTSLGYQRVYDIVGLVRSIWTGKQFTPAMFSKSKESTETIVVHMTGGREITCDPTHEFLVERWKGAGHRRKLLCIERISAKNLVVGDELHVSLPSDNKPDLFNRSDYTFGYMYGDGSFRQKGGGEITLCTEESKTCLSWFDPAAFSSINYKDSRGYTRCYVKSEFTTHNWYDKAAYVPYKLSNYSAIAGLFDSDGSYDKKHNRVRLASVHREFLVGVQRYLETIGILSHLNKGGKSTYGQQEGWMLVIASEGITRFSQLIPTKRFVVKPYTSYRKSSIKVLNKTIGRIQDVYCCDVGVEEHSFVAEGVTISNCTEVTSSDDSDVCNLGSINLGNISNLDEFKSVVNLASKFLVCGTLRADLPYDKVYRVREKNRRLGLGIMGIHEWLLQRGSKYEVTDDLHKWLKVYEHESKRAADEHCDRLFISHPVAYRAIAPTGSLSILANTSSGIEPLFAVAYKRRYLTDGTKWKYEYVVDATAERLIKECGFAPDKIDTAYKLSHDYERRIRFQADVQDYVDMSISSTINLPSWGSKDNNEDRVEHFARTLAKYAPRLRGFTSYPNGSRGGQPLVEVDYKEALQHKGVVFDETDICDITGRGGSCGA